MTDKQIRLDDIEKIVGKREMFKIQDLTKYLEFYGAQTFDSLNKMAKQCHFGKTGDNYKNVAEYTNFSILGKYKCYRMPDGNQMFVEYNKEDKPISFFALVDNEVGQVVRLFFEPQYMINLAETCLEELKYQSRDEVEKITGLEGTKLDDKLYSQDIYQIVGKKETYIIGDLTKYLEFYGARVFDSFKQLKKTYHFMKIKRNRSLKAYTNGAFNAKNGRYKCYSLDCVGFVFVAYDKEGAICDFACQTTPEIGKAIYPFAVGAKRQKLKQKYLQAVKNKPSLEQEVNALFGE